MRARQVLCICIWLLAWGLSAQNQMSLMTTLWGEFNGDHYGDQVVALDFNGDGYDDLVVKANKWNDTLEYSDWFWQGKLYFYWGGPIGLSTTPDYEIEGQWFGQYYLYPSHPTEKMCNAGDLNGDGKDDLAVICDYESSGYAASVKLFLGRANPSTTPDYVYSYNRVAGLWCQSLGDINGDGADELAISGWSDTTEPLTNYCYILDDLDEPPYLFDGNYGGGYRTMSGIGDVNNDGFSDAYYTRGTPGSNDARITLYFGAATCPFADSLVIYENYPYGAHLVKPLGDINGDGYADFIGYRDLTNYHIWLGSENMDAQPDLHLLFNTTTYDLWSLWYGSSGYAVHGDLNGDGFDDFATSDPLANHENGQAGICLGGQNANATYDLIMNPPSEHRYRNFGYAKAIGDYDGDGYDDLAISCPWWIGHSAMDTGLVLVYSGNASLTDTTVANDDPAVPPASVADWRINVYPNPCSSGIGCVSIELQGGSFSKEGRYGYALYNIRGQKLQEGLISYTEMQQRSFSLDLDGISSGIYQISLLVDGMIKTRKRIVLY